MNFATNFSNTPTKTKFKVVDMEAPIVLLDRMITYMKFCFITTEGLISWDGSELTWTEELRIYFIRQDGKLVRNIIDASTVAITAGRALTVTLHETDGQDITATLTDSIITTGATPITLTWNVLSLGYREGTAVEDPFIPTALAGIYPLRELKEQAVSSSSNVLDINWFTAKTATTLMTENISTLTFSNMRDGEIYYLQTTQDSGTPFDITFPGGIVWETQSSLIQKVDEIETFEFQQIGSVVYGRKNYPTTTHDLQFAVSSGVIPVGANFPSFEEFTPNSKEYAFAVGDYIDIDANELTHGWAEGTTGHVHLHLTTNDAVIAEEYAKFIVYLAYQQASGIWTETSFTAETPDLNGLADLKGVDLDMGDLDLSGLTIETRIKPRIKRIAATGGDEYGEDMFVNQLGIHLLSDSSGSRLEHTK